MEVEDEIKDVTIYNLLDEVLEAVFEFLEKEELLEIVLVCNKDASIYYVSEFLYGKKIFCMGVRNCYLSPPPLSYNVINGCSLSK